MKRLLPIVLFALMALVTACAPSRIDFTDSEATPGRAGVRVIEVKESSVHLQADNTTGSSLSSVSAKVMDGNVYLFPLYVSLPSSKTDFTVYIPNAPSGWKDKLYWVESDQYPNPFGKKEDRVRVIKRRKLDVP